MICPGRSNKMEWCFECPTNRLVRAKTAGNFAPAEDSPVTTLKNVLDLGGALRAGVGVPALAGRLKPGLQRYPTMNILLVSSEVVPFAKTGGLADVGGALPIELARLD